MQGPLLTCTILLFLSFIRHLEGFSLLPSEKNPCHRQSHLEQSSLKLEVSRRTALKDQTVQRDTVRSNLLNAIRESKPEEQVLSLIQQLLPFNSEYSNDTLQDLDGEWKLIWSANDDFSPLLKLPYPFKPESYQYFGKAAAKEVGVGRVAQGLTGGIFGKKQLWLSSGIEPLDKQGAFEIEPPFRLELGERPGTTYANDKRIIVEANNDGDFRKVNARTKEAQLAPKNVYEQIYLERNGKGSLRISTITDGDPVIVGAILIHEKL
jgi:hypothetical protein